MPQTTLNAVQPPRTPARVLLVLDQPVLAEVVKLALNHGRFRTDVAPTVDAALVSSPRG